MNSKNIYIVSMLLLVGIVLSLMYISEYISPIILWILCGWALLAGIIVSISHLCYNDENENENVRVYLDVAMIDRKIDYWRGRLCTARQADDFQDELEAQLHIEAYQEIRVNHGLERLEGIYG